MKETRISNSRLFVIWKLILFVGLSQSVDDDSEVVRDHDVDDRDYYDHGDYDEIVLIEFEDDFDFADSAGMTASYSVIAFVSEKIKIHKYSFFKVYF